MTNASLEFSMAIPQVFLDGRADMALVRNALQRAEELGYQGAWVQDQVTGEASLMESISLMCYAAAVTSKLRLGVSVLVFPIRDPVVLAKSVGSLDHMSNGRVTLGIGLGPVFAGDGYFSTFGFGAKDALGRFNEGLAIMKSLWTEPVTSFEGRYFHLHETAMEPKPVQKPHPPVWFGGQHPNALHRAVRKGDGYMGAGPTTTRDFGRQVEHIRRFLDEENRDPATFPISKRVYLAVDDDEARAKQGLDEFFQARYPWMIQSNPNFVADICVWGSPGRVAEGLAEVVEQGAEMILVNPLRDFVAQYERLAEEVFPLLR